MASQKTFGFGLKAFKKFPELIPLTGFVAGASAWAVIFIVYSLRTKPDVRVFGKNIEMPYEMVQPTESRKMVTLNQKYAPIDELEKLRKEIGSFKN